jgi:hypothetical protein
LASTYDDNAFSNNADKVGNVGYMVLPNISLRESRPRTDLIFSYSPGFTFNQRIAPQYTAAHELNLNFQYRLTEHVTARLHDDLIYGTNSFDRLNETPFEPGGSVLHQPNTAMLTPITNQLRNSAGADLIDQIGRGTMIGASGYFSRLHFLGSSTAAMGLLDNQFWSGDAFYSTRISRRSSLGATYSYQDVATLGSIEERTNSNTLLLFYTLYPKPGATLSFFAGPSYTRDKYASSTQTMWLVDGGFTLGWQGIRTSLQLTAIRTASDGGGLMGTVRTYSVNAGLRRQLTRRLLGTLNLAYSYNNPFVNPSTSNFYAVDGTAGMERTIGQRLSVAILYGRSHQTFGSSGSLANIVSDHNQGWATISYRFSRPLGR